MCGARGPRQESRAPAAEQEGARRGVDRAELEPNSRIHPYRSATFSTVQSAVLSATESAVTHDQATGDQPEDRPDAWPHDQRTGSAGDGKVCVVVGVGPGNGESFVRRFAAEGYRVAALARSEDRLRECVADIEGAGAYGCDATDPEQVREVFERIEADLGPVDVVLYNAGSGVWGGLEAVEASDLSTTWEVNTLGLFHVARHVVPAMRDRGRGVVGITGATAAMRGKAATTAFAQAKAAQRSLAQSLAREFGPAGIHVFYFIVDGVIDLPRTREQMPDKPAEFFLDPDDIAHTVWSIAHQPRSAWTFELDIRPHCESW